MNENQTLEMQILAKSEEAIKSLDKLITKLTGVEQVVNKVDKTLNKGTVKKTSDNLNNLKNSTDKTTKSVEKLDKALSLSGAYLGARRLTTTFLQWISYSKDMTESLNLFNVVFKNIEKNGKTLYSNLGKEATKFQYKLNEAFGTNKITTFEYQGLFQSMGENVGIPDTYSAIMSEAMTKLTYDLASLYNKQEKTTAEALRAGVYAGQTKPLRSYGIDVTQTSMQPILKELGITDRSVKQLSQAEKEILRYLVVMKQSKVAHGDFANTLESPANQLKIFSQQLIETKASLSSLFIGTFANILPYANAFLMVIKEISKSIATMFGINLSDFNSGIASSEDAYVDLEDSVNNATDAVKELKRQTLGFDQINNINENKNTGSDTNVSGGIDKRLLDAIKGYDNGMEKVRMKATEIRDRIMEWLGFTKEIDPLTGELSFKYQGWKTTLKNVVSSFLKLNTQGKILVGLGLVVGATKLWATAKKLVNILGGSGLIKVLKNMLSPLTSIIGNVKEYIKYSPSLLSGIKTAISDWGASASALDKVKLGLVGIIGLSLSLDGMSSSMKDLANNGMTLNNTLGILTSGLGSVASGAMIGTSIMPGLGTVIGAVGGAVASLITGLISYNSATSEAKDKTDKYSESLVRLREEAQESVLTELVQIEHTAELVTELEKLIDSNGKVKAGYEERVAYILNQLNNAFGTEYELVNGAITHNGKLVTSYEEIKSSVEDLIKTKKAEIVLEAYKEEYITALKKEKSTVEEVDKANQDFNETIKKLNSDLEKGLISQDVYNTHVANATKKHQDKLKELQKQYDENHQKIIDYDNLLEASVSKNSEKMDKALSKYIITSEKNVKGLFSSIENIGNSCKVNFEKSIGSLNNKNVTINIKANTDPATKSMNTFFGKISKSTGVDFPGITWTPQYANGGFPEDGLFFANHNELVGKFTNGKTAVANNAQIVEGIKAGVYEAVITAMSQTGGQASQIDLHLYTDEGVVVDKINQTTKQTGVCPIIIPVS